MNERIQELADQAAEYAIELTVKYPELYIPTFTEKFTELIVQECASIFEGVYTDQQRPERIDTRIKSHFGVE